MNAARSYSVYHHYPTPRTDCWNWQKGMKAPTTVAVSWKMDIHIRTQRYIPEGSKKGGIFVATFYASDNLPALVFLEFEQMCSQNLKVARCANCGRLFVPFPSKARYCEHVADPQTGGTCKEIAAKQRYAEEVWSDKAKLLYNQLRNKYQMRGSRAPENKKMREKYDQWRKAAQRALVKYQVGEIDFKRFREQII